MELTQHQLRWLSFPQYSTRQTLNGATQVARCHAPRFFFFANRHAPRSYRHLTPPPPPAPMEAVAVPRSAAACRVAPALPASRATARPLPPPRSALSAPPGRRLVARRVPAAGDKVETAQEAVPIEKSRSICSTPMPRPSVLGSC
jgi:hypothetical protein